MTRADLPLAVQAVQAAHAALDLAVAHPELTSAWHASSNTLVLLAVPDELALCWLLEDACRRQLIAVPFHEPDLGDALTAVALEPQAARLCSKYPLALAEGARHDHDS